MRHKSTASRLRTRFSSVTDRLAELVKTLSVRRMKQGGGGIMFIGPEFYFGDRSTDQQATQLTLKREYEVISELLKLLVRGGPDGLVSGFEQADNRFRDWLDLNGSWSVTAGTAENAKKVREAAEPIERILDVLDAAGKDDMVVVPETNSLLANADPTAYRGIAGQKSFVFMLLPTVLGELDKLKIEHRNPDVREEARKVIDRIKGWRKQALLFTGLLSINLSRSWLPAENPI